MRMAGNSDRLEELKKDLRDGLIEESELRDVEDLENILPDIIYGVIPVMNKDLLDLFVNDLTLSNRTVHVAGQMSVVQVAEEILYHILHDEGYRIIEEMKEKRFG